MGPYQRTPKKKVTRAIKYTGLGVRSVGPVGDFLEKNMQLLTLYDTKTLWSLFFVFSNFHRIKNIENKIHSKPTFVKNFRRGNTSRSDFSPKTSDSLKRSQRIYLSKPVPRVEIERFLRRVAVTTINLHMSSDAPPTAIEKRTGMTLKAIFFFSAPTLTFLIFSTPPYYNLMIDALPVKLEGTWRNHTKLLQSE